MFHNVPYGPPPPMQQPPPVLRPAPPPLAAQPPPLPTPMNRLDLSRVPPLQHAAAIEFDSFCDHLTFNSKDLITTLTKIAGENTFNAEGIVAVLEQRILATPPHAKLPFLYLTDSIMKNIGRPFVNIFACNISHVFAAAYAAVAPNVRGSMHRLLITWSSVFGVEMVESMKARIAPIDTPYSQQPPIIPYSATVQHIPLSHPMPPVSAPGIMHQPHQQPRHPFAPPIPPQPSSPHFLQLQNSMSQLTKDASMGITPTDHKVFSINSQITSLLQHPYLSPVERDSVQHFQRQLRELSMPPRNNHSVAHVQRPAPPGAQPLSRAMPLSTTAALSSLLRNPPPGLLGVPTPPASMQVHARGPSRAPPLRAIRPTSSIPAVPRRQPPTVPVFSSRVSPVLKFSDIKTFSHASAVRSLYTDLPFLSKSDGMRFKTQEQLREHLDWVFKRNRSKRARSSGTTQGERARCWYEPFQVFLNGDMAKDAELGMGGGSTEQSGLFPLGQDGLPDGRGSRQKKIAGIPAISVSERCGACGEELDASWDDGQSCWMLKEATRTEDSVYHTKCMSSTVDMEAEHGSFSTALSPTKGEKDEPTVDRVLKLESKALPGLEQAESKGKADARLNDTKRERENMTGTTIKCESQTGVIAVALPTTEMGQRGSLLTATPGASVAGKTETVLKQEALPMKSKKRARDDGVGSGVVGGSSAGTGTSPEKRVKV